MRAGRVTAYAVLAWGLSAAGPAFAATGGATEAYPPLGLAESSGMAASSRHPGVVWVVEDGAFDQSLPPVVHAYDASGAEVATVTLAGWNNRDVEGLSMGPGPALWVADIGDNSLLRDSVVVHTFAEPGELGATSLEPTSYRLRYPDGPRDAESIMVDPLTGRLYVASKSVIGGGSLYVAPEELVAGETHDLELVAGVPSFVTDGAFTPDGGRMVLLTVGLQAEALVLDVVRDADGYITDLVEAMAFELPRQQQPETLAISLDGTIVLVGSEDPGGVGEPIWAVPLPPASNPATSAPVDESPSSVPTRAPDATVEPGDCGLDDPASCFDEPTGWLIAGVVGLAALMTGALAVLRRSTQR